MYEIAYQKDAMIKTYQEEVKGEADTENADMPGAVANDGATSTPAHLIFTKPWFYQTSSVPSSSVPHLEFTTGVREQ